MRIKMAIIKYAYIQLKERVLKIKTRENRKKKMNRGTKIHQLVIRAPKLYSVLCLDLADVIKVLHVV